ncbi:MULTISPECIES: SDR family NAD(P)-dependent oxidoreductase [Pedobacter]|uniref:SDR family NAD(P)-dependent oxidoreductase n=1 Tax=Pedobacter TaxID=84567 RepID=UPI001CC25D75|nr:MULTISPECIES: SDR family NAD(P)-dependent oxidoreductase [Pedobacter]NII84794.1 short-subunit dehydrogenase involved in D-alanine esterification of teichoic acids [Pedobacter sp. SG908]
MKSTGNTVFISGRSAGIGLAIAKKLSAAGNKIIINGRSEERLTLENNQFDVPVGDAKAYASAFQEALAKLKG